MVFGLCFAPKRKQKKEPLVSLNDVEKVKRFERILNFYDTFALVDA